MSQASSADSSESGGQPILFLFIGASNLARGFICLTRFLRRALPDRPVEFMYALGPGRGYHAVGGIFNINYPPIEPCGIFSAAQQKAEAGYQVVALVMDFGNDLMYDVLADQLIETLDKTFVRLKKIGADTLIVPITSTLEKQQHALVFKGLRKIFYPNSRVPLEKAFAGIRTVNQFLNQLAGKEVRLLSGLEEHIGVDKIHYSAQASHKAWSKIGHEMLKSLNVETGDKINIIQMTVSYFLHLYRLFSVDVFKIRKPKAEFY